MKRKRKKTRVRVTPFLWMVLAVNVWVGLSISPVTSARRIKIEGANEDDHLALANAVQSLKGIPCSKVNPLEVESAVLRDPAIRTAELSRSVFGSARLRVGYRKIVARFYTNPKIGVSLDGLVFRSNHIKEDLPVLKVPPGEVQVALGMVASWDCGRLAALCADVKERWPRQVLQVELTEDQGVCLNIGSGRVVLGAADDIDTKLKVLQERLTRNPTELDDIQELILTNPSSPMVRRKTGDKGL